MSLNLLHRLAVAAVAAPTLILTGWSVVDPSRLRLVAAGTAFWLLAAVGASAPRKLLYAVVVWLTALGLLRRLASSFTGSTPTDPLLLVAPAAMVALALAAGHHNAFRLRSRLSVAVLGLAGLILAGAANPIQRSLLSGFAGLLFLLIPMLAFWIGRALCDDRTLARILKLFAGLAPVVAAYGLAQTFHGFPSWDAEWIARSGYTALNVGGVIRPFSTFSSAAEYGYYLAIAIVVWIAFGVRAGHYFLTAAAVSLLSTALVYESSRAIVVSLMIALGLMTAAWRRLPILASAAVGATFLGAFVIVLRQWDPPPMDEGTSSALVSHQVAGFTNPLDPKHSTLLIHLGYYQKGLRSVASHPLGMGTGSVSIAAQKFGGVGHLTEADPSNVAVAFGIPGLVLYLTTLTLGFHRAYAIAQRRRDPVAFAGLSILGVTLFQWLNGGQYAVAFLPWLILGWVDRQVVFPGSSTRTPGAVRLSPAPVGNCLVPVVSLRAPRIVGRSA